MAPRRPARRRVCSALWWLWILVLALAALSRFFAALAWPIDLLANVSYFACVPALLTALAAAARRRWPAAAAAVMLALVAAWPVRWVIVSPSAATPAGGEPGSHVVHVLEANVHGSHVALDGLISLIERVRPDVLVAIEVQPGLEAYLSENETVRSILPFAIGPERGMLWRDMMLSRHPMHRLHFDGDDQRYQHLFAYRRSCFIEDPSGRYLLTAMHPPSPREAASWMRGNEWTSLLAEVCRQQLLPTGVPVVIGGDFNSTPSGYRHRIMLSRSGLVPSDRLGGIEGTWPSDWPAPARLTLDRVWVSPEVRLLSREVLEDIGSDHRPILVTLSLPTPPVRHEGENGR